MKEQQMQKNKYNACTMTINASRNNSMSGTFEHKTTWYIFRVPRDTYIKNSNRLQHNTFCVASAPGEERNLSIVHSSRGIVWRSLTWPMSRGIFLFHSEKCDAESSARHENIYGKLII